MATHNLSQIISSLTSNQGTIVNKLSGFVIGVNSKTSELSGNSISGINFDKENNNLLTLTRNNSKILSTIINISGNYLSGVNPSGVGNFTFNDKLLVDEQNIVYANNLNISNTNLINEQNKLSRKYQADIASMTCTSFDYSKIKFYGNCKVDYGIDGTIKIRIGDPLNCSVWNNTDGISDGLVKTNTAPTSISRILSKQYNWSTTSGQTTNIVTGTQNFIVKTGTTQTTQSVAGNSIHFDDNVSGKFVIIAKISNNTKTWEVGPITGLTIPDGNKTFTNGPVTLNITKWNEQPKKTKGATGYCGLVAFTIAINNMCTRSQDFELISISQYEGSTLVNTWNTVSPTNNKYFYLKQTTVQPGKPIADYAFTSVIVKKYSGLKYITIGSKFNISGTNLINLGFPANYTYAARYQYVNNTWCSNAYLTSTDITSYTTLSGVARSFIKSNLTPLKGAWSNPEIRVLAYNFNNSTGISSDNTDKPHKLLICDNNGCYNDTDKGSFSMVQGQLEAGKLALLNGCIVYPTKLNDFSDYNKTLSGIPGGTELSSQTSYSKDTARTYTKDFTFSGTKSNGTVTLTHIASISNAIMAKTLVVEILDGTNNWQDVSINGIGTSISQYGDTISKFVFKINKATEYISNSTTIKITMSDNVGQIKNITLE